MDANVQPLASLRASSWSDLLDCALRWYAKYVLGVTKPVGGAAYLGTSLHAGTGAFDSSRLPGGSPINIDDACGVFVDKLHHPDEDVKWTEDDTPLKEAERIGLTLTTRYCTQIAPTKNYVAVEHTFDALDVGTEYGVMRFTGTTDRIRELQDGRKGVSDLKSGTRAVEGIKTTPRAVTDKHGPQVGLYTLLAEQSLGLRLDAPGEIIGLQTGGGMAVATGEIAEPKLALIGTDDQPGLIEIAAKMLKTGVFPPNPGSNLCSEKFCAYYSRCIYRPR